MRSPQLNEWRDWCRGLANDISNSEPFSTGTNLDILQPGKEVDMIPGEVLAARWGEEVFRKSVSLYYAPQPGAVSQAFPLQDADIEIDLSMTPPGNVPARVWLTICHDLTQFQISFDPGSAPLYRLESPTPEGLEIEADGERAEFIDYLNNHPLSLILTDCSFLDGRELRIRQAETKPIASESFISFDWFAEGVSINREFADERAPKAEDGAIHGHMLKRLEEEGAAVIVYDHGSGEAADFIGVWDNANEVLVRFYHCKKTKQAAPTCRLDDLYEVAGQAVKTNRWLHRPDALLEHLKRRSNGRPWRFPVGRLLKLAELLRTAAKPVAYEVAIVQPGLSYQKLTPAASEVLGAANEFLWRDVGGRHLMVLCSP